MTLSFALSLSNRNFNDVSTKDDKDILHIFMTTEVDERHQIIDKEGWCEVTAVRRNNVNPKELPLISDALKDTRMRFKTLFEGYNDKWYLSNGDKCRYQIKALKFGK